MRSHWVVRNVPEYCIVASRKSPPDGQGSAATAMRRLGDAQKTEVCFGAALQDVELHRNERYSKSSSRLRGRIGRMRCGCCAAPLMARRNAQAEAGRGKRLKALLSTLIVDGTSRLIST